MTVANVLGKPAVVKRGGAVEERYAYVDGGVLDAGDLIRINTAGEVVVAGATNTEPPHGIVLQSVATEVNEPCPVLLFAADTVISIACIDGEAPTDLTKGLSYTLETSGGVWGVTATTTNGSVLVVDYADTGTPWVDAYSSFDNDSSVDNNRVHVKVKQSLLDTYAA